MCKKGLLCFQNDGFQRLPFPRGPPSSDVGPPLIVLPNRNTILVAVLYMVYIFWFGVTSSMLVANISINYEHVSCNLHVSPEVATCLLADCYLWCSACALMARGGRSSHALTCMQPVLLCKQEDGKGSKPTEKVEPQ